MACPTGTEQLVEYLAQAVPEPLRRELRRAAPDTVDIPPVGVCGTQCLGEGIRVLRGDEEPVLAMDDVVQRTSCGVGDDGHTCREALDRADAEVLLPGEDEGRRVRQ